MRSTHDLIAADRRHVWHPFTQQQGWSEDETPMIIARGEGFDLYDTDGNAYLDGVSSLWCNVHGHHHPVIDAAIRDQLDRVAHSTMLGLTHEPAIVLAERLAAIAPGDLERVFYSESGSTAVEIALKMAFQWWAQRGETQRTRFICLENAYHGDTSERSRSAASSCFTRCTARCCSTPCPPGPATPSISPRCWPSTESEVAAVIVEPLVQGAAGMLMQPDGYLREVRELCDRHGVLLICDEVATGFGRTGRMFACEHEGVVPDLMCVAKGLTGGYLPLAATLATERIYEGFLGRFEEYRTFFHGHTYTGNPWPARPRWPPSRCSSTSARSIACPARSPPCTRRSTRGVEPLAGVAEVRRRGLMVGIELPSAEPAGAARAPGHARRPRAGSDHAPAGRRGRADAAAVDQRGRARAPGGDHRHGDRAGDRPDAGDRSDGRRAGRSRRGPVLYRAEPPR